MRNSIIQWWVKWGAQNKAIMSIDYFRFEVSPVSGRAHITYASRVERIGNVMTLRHWHGVFAIRRLRHIPSRCLMCAPHSHKAWGRSSSTAQEGQAGLSRYRFLSVHACLAVRIRLQLSSGTGWKPQGTSTLRMMTKRTFPNNPLVFNEAVDENCWVLCVGSFIQVYRKGSNVFPLLPFFVLLLLWLFISFLLSVILWLLFYNSFFSFSPGGDMLQPEAKPSPKYFFFLSVFFCLSFFNRAHHHHHQHHHDLEHETSLKHDCHDEVLARTTCASRIFPTILQWLFVLHVGNCLRLDCAVIDLYRFCIDFFIEPKLTVAQD